MGVGAGFSHSTVALCIVAAPLLAQQTPTITLRPAIAAAEREFTNIGGVRELDDNTVLVADVAETTLVVLDFDRQTARQIGRVGRGPGEYSDLGTIWALTGDSTLVPDPGNQRWLMLAGSSIVATVPPDAPAVRLAGSAFTGVDTLGGVLTQRRFGRRLKDGPLTVESLAVLRVSRRAGQMDTIARIRWRPYAAPPGAAAMNPMVSRAFGVPLKAPEQSMLFSDGWIAVARLDPYRVDWREPSGAWRLGAPLPFSPLPVTAGEKRAYVERAARATGRGVVDPERIPHWPEHMDPFIEGALIASPDGRLVIARTPTATAPGQRYDLVDRQGRLSAVLQLPEGERIVGFGRQSVFVVATDREGIERLRRHPWP